MISKGIYYVGVNDHDIDLFEGQYIVPDGMAYNSYVVMDSKIAVMDTVDKKFTHEWIENIKSVLSDRQPDYLIVSHMEPDHSANIMEFMNTYKDAVIVATQRAFDICNKFFSTDFADRRVVVGDNDTLDLGEHTLSFCTAPMVHWPEVMMTYDALTKTLFSADAFGKFGALDVEAEWACEARRYYFGIVGKYGAQVQAVFKKIRNLDIATICPLHGPVLSENLGYYLDLYNTWSTYSVESEGVAVFYTSVYGNTKQAVELLTEELEANGAKKVAVTDLARDDMAEAVEDAFRYGKIVLATTTYNSEIFPFMHQFIHALLERGYKDRTIGIIENGSWAPTAARVIKKLFENSKNLNFVDPVVTIHSALNSDSTQQIKDLAKEILK